MSFSTLHGVITLTSLGGAWEAIDARPKYVESGWDEISVTYAAFLPAGKATQVQASFPIGVQISGTPFYVTGVAPRQGQGGIWFAEVTGKGLGRPRPIKVKGKTGADQQQGKNVRVQAEGVVKKLQTLEASPTVEIERLIVGLPPTQQVGTAGFPAITPRVRQSIWQSLPDPLFHYPNRWVMVDMPWEQLPGTNVTLYTEVWMYIFPFSPGGD